MKKISTLIVCLLLASFVFAGVPAVSRLAEPKIVEAQDGPDRLAELLTVVAKKVDVIPEIDGDFSEWDNVRGKSIGASAWKAVYTDDEVAMYIRWMDPDANIDTRGTWNWDNEAQAWWQTGMEPGTYKQFGMWFSISFDISSDVSDAPMGEVGCGAFCHETTEGSGGRHHQTGAVGSYVDTWLVLSKHGFGSSAEDSGFLLGATGASQEGELIFNPSSAIDARAVMNGNMTFVGYAEDKVFASPDDPMIAARDNPADQYCQNCHEQLEVSGDPLNVNLTFGDPGDILYSENWNADHTAPLYIEVAPENWVDAMVLTQAEIDAGEAVAVADLSEAELAEYWGKYEALNGNVPQLIKQEPSGSQADVRVAANWKNGFWTVELKRKLATGSEYDVQFDDLSKDYRFAVSLFCHADIVGGTGNIGWTLRFEQ